MLNYLTGVDILTLFRVTADFVIIWFLIYWLLYFLRGTQSANILFGVIAFLVVAVLLVQWLEFPILKFLLERVWIFLGAVILVIFQPELRRAFAQAGSIFSHAATDEGTIDQVAKAAVQMSRTHTGALIVFEQNIGLENIEKASVVLSAKVNAKLLETIFFKNSPLHDCAVIIRKNKIVAARAVLPMTQEDNNNPVRRLGTRHRAAVGITEHTDAVVLAVSEETGMISIAHNGHIVRGFTPEELPGHLKILLAQKPSTNKYKNAFSSLWDKVSKGQTEQSDSAKDDSEDKL